MPLFTNVGSSAMRTNGRTLGALLLLVLTVTVAAALPLVYFTNLPSLYDERFGSILAPKIYLLALLACGPFLLLDRMRVTAFIRQPYVLWLGALFLLNVVCIFRLGFIDGTISDREDMLRITRQLLLAPAFAYLVWSIDTSWFVRFIKALCILAPAMVLFDFLNPGVMYDYTGLDGATSGRAGGPWFNANVAAEALLLALVLGCARFGRTASIAVYLLIGAAVIVTGSRSGMVGWLLVGALLIHRRALPRVMLLTPIVLTVFYGTIYIFLEDLASSIPEHQEGASRLLARLDFVSGNVDATEGGGSQRFEVAENALRETLGRPILGYGYAYEDQITEIGAGPHNLIIQMWHLYGLPGLLLWGSLAWMLLGRDRIRGLANPALFCFVWFSFFSHNILGDNHWYVFFALLFFATNKSPRVSVSGGGLHGISRDVGDVLPRRVRGSRRTSRPGRRRRPRSVSW